MLVKHDIQDWLEITPWFVEYMYMISEDTVLLTSRYHFANQRIPKQSLYSYMHWNVRMHKDKNFSFVSTEFLIGLNSHQILWNLQAACILILRFVNNFLITKSHLSLLIKSNRNPTIYNCKLFLGIVCNSYDWPKPYTKRHPLKMEFHKLPIVGLCIVWVKITYSYVRKVIAP